MNVILLMTPSPQSPKPPMTLLCESTGGHLIPIDHTAIMYVTVMMKEDNSKIIKSNLTQMDTHTDTLKYSLHSDAEMKWQR